MENRGINDIKIFVMYLTIILLPLLSALISGFMGRKIGIKGSQLLSCLTLTLTSFLAIIAFYEVGLNESPISIVIFNWLDSESIKLSWGFLLDSLSVSMLLPVLIVSTAVHYYSIGYMKGDPAEWCGISFIGSKLPNSGEALKLMIPNLSRKTEGGWTNYSCMVTSHKMIEKEIGNRGSKSE